jgi:hypothetical protein
MSKKRMSDKEGMMGNRDEETPPKLFFTTVPHNRRTNHTEMPHCCQDLYRPILFKLIENSVKYFSVRRYCL